MSDTKMIKDLFNVQSGLISPNKFKLNQITRRVNLIELSKHQVVANALAGGVNSLDIDKSENRYLLSGCWDGSIYIHDLYNFSGFPHYTANCVCKVNLFSDFSCVGSVGCISWFGNDNALFITSTDDHTLKVWDANTMKPVESYHSQSLIYYHESTSLPSSHAVVAVASSIDVELIDLRTGSSTHKLRGHDSSVLACAWSPSREYFLATGGIDNKIIFWDIRFSGTFLRSLDKYNRERAARIAHHGCVNGLRFTSDGLFLISLGTDNRIRLWETLNGKHQMINYGMIKNNLRRHLKFVVTNNLKYPLAYVPSKKNVYVVDVYRGNITNVLKGHFNTVYCSYYRDLNQELYTSGKDRNILVWTPDNSHLEAFAENAKQMIHFGRMPGIKMDYERVFGTRFLKSLDECDKSVTSHFTRGRERNGELRVMGSPAKKIRRWGVKSRNQLETFCLLCL